MKLTQKSPKIMTVQAKRKKKFISKDGKQSILVILCRKPCTAVWHCVIYATAEGCQSLNFQTLHIVALTTHYSHKHFHTVWPSPVQCSPIH